MRVKILLAVTLTAILGTIALSPRVAEAHGDVVTMKESYTPGTIIVRTAERRLYYVTGWSGQAISYPVGVGRAGKQWSGTSYISGKYRHPAWSPPPAVLRDSPHMARLIPGGSPHNPMGVAAMTIGSGEYAIHGTNKPDSVGHFVSYGCIRMYNADITDLFSRVSVGTRVIVQ